METGKNKIFSILAAICLGMSSFLCTAVYVPLFTSAVKDYNYFIEWRADAVMQGVVMIILIAICLLSVLLSLAAIASALWKFIDAKTVFGVFFSLASVKYILTFIFLLYLVLDHIATVGFKAGLDLLAAVIVGFLATFLPAVIMAMMCFLSKAKPENKLLRLRFIPVVIYALPYLFLACSLFLGVMFYISDYGIGSLIRESAAFLIPILIVGGYMAGMFFVTMTLKKKSNYKEVIENSEI